MQLTRREEIAIGVLVACAHAGSGRIRTEDAAASTGVSLVQAAQVVHRLMLAGLVATVRGKHGGIGLSRRPEEITLAEVLNLVGSRRRLPARAQATDPLSAIASAADAQALQAFESFTIADLAEGRVGDKLTCFECSIRLQAVRHVAGDHRRRPQRGELPVPQPPERRTLPLNI